MLAPATEFHNGNGRCSHEWKSVLIAFVHPASGVGTDHWYTRNPASHGIRARARNRGPSVPARTRDALRLSTK